MRKNQKKDCFIPSLCRRLGLMPKPVLGRNLGTLLGRDRKESAPAAKPLLRGPAEVSPGVRSLLRGSPQASPKAGAPPARPLPAWYLFAGDVLLVGLALLTIYKSPHPLPWPRMVFCALLAALAAGLGIMAISSTGTGVLTDRKTPKKFGNDKANQSHPEQ